MKFCFSVCEYDPFHLGHAHHLSQTKNCGADATCIIQSGNFTQRGEIAIMDKYARAEHAVKAGADVVVELPTVFATAPAEIFASGAVKIASAVGGGTLLFGTEMGTKADFLQLASALNVESKQFKLALKRQLQTGESFATARTNALKQVSPDLNFELLQNPNSVLGVEYVKSILQRKADLDVVPIPRIGAGFNDKSLLSSVVSASALREQIALGKRKNCKKYVPSFVFNDLPETLPDVSQVLLYSVLNAPSNQIAKVQDCTEGLENRIKSLAPFCHTTSELLQKLATKRYTLARLRRILTSVMLGVEKTTVLQALKGDLYVKVLAVAKDRMDVLSCLGERLNGTKTTLITRKSDADKLVGIAKKCFQTDAFATQIYNLVCKTDVNAYDMRITER